MQWLIIAAAVAVALVLFKFVVKPLFKVIAIAGLALLVWLLLTNFL